MIDSPCDDRGQPVRDASLIEWNEIEPAWRDIGPEGRRRILISAAIALACAGTAAYLWWFTGRRIALILLLLSLAVVPVFWGSITAGLRWSKGIAEVKRRSLCPACHYDIAGCAAQADGCTVCPECGAAWRVGKPA